MKTFQHRHRSSGQFSQKQFLLQVAAAIAAVPAKAAVVGRPKVLMVVAHPDDEYAFAAATYRIIHELHGTVDQLIITNGEGGYRYSRLAESFYGVALSQESVGRQSLPAIRKGEALRAGKILGVRHHFFLDQRDARFTLDGQEAFSGIWDIAYVRCRLVELLRAETYDFVFVLLPTPETHGHHQAAALLALEAVSELAEPLRPVVLGCEASAEIVPKFGGRPDLPLMRLAPGAPVYSVSRKDKVVDAEDLTYSIIVNWVIAEHKSQGLFQTEYGKHSQENFWVFDNGSPHVVAKADSLLGPLSRTRKGRAK